MSQKDKYKPLTVKELIEILKDFPQEAIVFSEGCDCSEEACWVGFYLPEKTDSVEIKRAGTSR